MVFFNIVVQTVKSKRSNSSYPVKDNGFAGIKASCLFNHVAESVKSKRLSLSFRATTPCDATSCDCMGVVE